MADVNINVGNISSINLREQGSNPSAPGAGIRLFDKATGIYFIDSGSVVAGPLNAIFTPGGRLSMVSGTAVTTTDIYSGTSLWYSPYVTDMIPLWDGNKIVPVQFAPTQLSLSGLSGTSSFDVFGYYSSGNLALESSMWTSPTVRATNISMQNGRLCKVGDATRLYLGSFYTSSGGKADDNVTKRNIFNYYNRLKRRLSVIETTNSWTYSTETWRSFNNSTANRFEIMVGVDEIPVYALASALSSTNSDGNGSSVGIGLDATNTNSATIIGFGNNLQIKQHISIYDNYTTVGFHYLQMLELGQDAGGGGGIVTWYGDAGVPTYLQSGMIGHILA